MTFKCVSTSSASKLRGYNTVYKPCIGLADRKCIALFRYIPLFEKEHYGKTQKN